MILAADLGGTRMRAARVSPAGGILARVEAPTPVADPTPAAFVALLRELRDGCTSAVLGIPGRFHHGTGVMEHAPNLPAAWAPALSEGALADALGLPVRGANDADLAAVGEAHFGAGRGHPDLVFLTFSTGVGGGVLLGGRLVHGARSGAEVGWQVIDRAAMRRGEPCTLEHLASGTALGRLGAAAGIDGGGPAVVARAQAGDPVASRVFAEVVEAASIGVANVCFYYSPSRVVIGGGLGRVGEAFLGPIRAFLAAHGPPGLRIEVVPAELGDDAALVGAAGWARAVGLDDTLAG